MNQENENLRKDLEEAKEKISNLLNNINTLFPHKIILINIRYILHFFKMI